MQLDQTHVVIRLRTMSEIGDLALFMIRKYPVALFGCFLVGAFPWIATNAILLSWIPIQEAKYGLDDPEAASELARYGLWMAILVILQTPIAGALTTFYLGQAVFEKRPSWQQVVTGTRQRWAVCLWALGFKRLAIPALIIMALRYGSPFSAAVDVALPIGLWILVAVFRGSRPFVPEIILLEQCPLRSQNSSTITISARSSSLHKSVAGELSGRFLTISMLLSLGFFAVLFTLAWARGVVTGYWTWGLVTLLFMYPFALWTIAGLSVFVRFLNYLDTRIRLEGWEVELAVRAEAIRQFGTDKSENAHESAAGSS